VWEDKAQNFERVLTQVEGAGIEPGSLIVLPELFATGFSMNVAGMAEPRGGPTETFLADLARRYKSYVIGGMVTRDDDGAGLNDAVVFDSTGKEIVRYCKLHPFSFGRETEHYVAGDALVTFDQSGWVVAPFICYDLRFPEPFRVAARRGAGLMVVIANWPAPRTEHWSSLLRARAIENQSYVIGVNRCGSDPLNEYSGRSMAVGPRGEILDAADDKPALIRTELDMDALQDYRAKFPALQDMRSDYDTL
jgi:predicted amidohydrolase